MYDDVGLAGIAPGSLAQVDCNSAMGMASRPLDSECVGARPAGPTQK